MGDQNEGKFKITNFRKFFSELEPEPESEPEPTQKKHAIQTVFKCGDVCASKPDDVFNTCWSEVVPADQHCILHL